MSEGTIADVLEGRATWCVVTGDCIEVMAGMPDRSVDHVMADTPYSAETHNGIRSSGRNRGLVAGDGKAYACNTRRTVDLGFTHLSDALRAGIARETERLANRWGLFFSDIESCHLWREAFTSFDYVRTGIWDRIGGAPQFSGDRPAVAAEVFTLVHRKGRKRWNGGGKRALYSFPIVLNRLGQQGTRVHPTQKPEELMMALVEDYTDTGEIVLDPTCGSATTGAAALRLGRRFIGIEMDEGHAQTSRERLLAEETGSTLAAQRAGQLPMFGARP